MPKISALGTISQLTTSSILPVVDNNETQKVTLKRIVEFVSASIDVTFATEIELLQSASSITSSLNAFASASILSVNSKLSTSSFEAYTASVQSVNTSSLLLSSSFNTYTSSNDTTNTTQNSRLTSLETNSGSYLLKTETGSFALTSSLPVVTPFLSSSTFNTYTSSLSGVISGSFQITNLGFATTSSVLNIDTSSLVTTSSFNTYTASISTASLVSRLNQIESVSGSWITESETGSFALTANLPVVTPFLSSSVFNTYTSSLLGAISSSTQITNLGFATTSSLAVVTPFLSSSVFNTFATSSNTFTASVDTTIASLNTFSSSVNTFTSSANTALSNVYTATSSLNTFTSSINTTIKSKLNTDGVISGSSQLPSGLISGSSQLPSGLVSGSSQVLNSSNILSSSVEGFSAFSSSVNSRINSAGGGSTDVSMFLSQSVFNTFATSSFMAFTASVNTFTSSANTALSNVYTATASLNSKTGSYATTGSNQFKDNQTITGSLTVTALTTISSSISANSSSLYLSSGSNLYVQNNGLVEITGSINLSGSITIKSGSITMVNRPAFRVSGSASTDRGVNTILSGSAVSVDYNEGGYFNTTNGKFTAPIDGLYHVYFNGRVGSTNSPMQVIVYKNTNISTLMWESQTNTGASHFGVSGILKLAVNDTLEAKVTVGSIQFDGNDSWGATFIG